MTAQAKFVVPALILGMFTVACEEKNPAPVEAPPAATASEGNSVPQAAAAKAEEVAAAAVSTVKEAATPSPADVCQTLVAAAKAKDESKLTAQSTPATATALGAPGAKDHVMTTLAAATCGSATVEGDSATVPLGSTQPAQEATFTKTAEGWKFDGAAFLAKYPLKVVQEKAKKAANKLHGKGSAHKKHK